MSTKPVREFQINVTVEHGQLREYLASATDRQLMIDRLEEILLDTSAGRQAVREGVIQILIDQLVNDNGHEPLFIRTGDDPADPNREQILWNSEIIETRPGQSTPRGQIKPIEVKVDKFRDTGKTPKQPGKPDNPFNFNGNTGQQVHSHEHKNGAKDQKFYKFEIEAEDGVGQKLKLDPCIICDR